MRSSLAIAVVVLLASGVSGCGWLDSRSSCPTDARHLMLSCAGEEAVRRCPCGPDASFYGHRRTTWNAWPEGWRDAASACHEGCGMAPSVSCEPVGGVACESCEAEGATPCDCETSNDIGASTWGTPTPAEAVAPESSGSWSAETAPLPPSTPLELSAPETNEGPATLIEPEESVPSPPSMELELPEPPPAVSEPISLPEPPPAASEPLGKSRGFRDFFKRLPRVVDTPEMDAPVGDAPDEAAAEPVLPPPAAEDQAGSFLPPPSETHEAPPARSRYVDLFTP